MGKNPVNSVNASNTFESRLTTMREIMLRIDAATSARELGARLVELTKPFGVNAVLAGVLPQNLDLQPLNSALTPEEWKLLADHASFADDRSPLLIIDLEHLATHFFYLEPICRHITHKQYTTLEASAVRALWSHFDGLLFPIVALGETQCGFAFLGQSVSRDDAAIKLMSFTAYCAFARTLKLDIGAEHLRKLSERQLEALRWAAKGKTDQEIADIMNISVYTVDKYMRQCKETLGAINRTKLIVLAMRCGLIS